MPDGGRRWSAGTIVVLVVFVGLAIWLFGGLLTFSEPPSRVAGADDAGGPVAADGAIPADVMQPAASGTAPDTAPAAAAVARSEARGNAASVDPAWASEQAARIGIPLRALLGYAGAELAMRTEAPGCRIGWSTLAAIGNLESGHGTHAGSALDVAGVARPAIFGPELDGGDYERIDDTDGGRIDGTAATDRAVGPMQFIPSTWAEWGADGNGDGVADPQQIDDAALAAAGYLCHSGDLSDAAVWRTAVYSYNHVDAYVDAVADAANEYASRARG
ncbi:lytic transglycosylase domain-containing protein [Agromyces bauzanensis]